jgi:competence protein ComFC
MNETRGIGAKIAGSAAEFGSELLDFLLGAPCLVCEERLSDGYQYFCESCLESASVFESALCANCKSPVMDVGSGCKACGWQGPIQLLWACGEFDDFFRPIVHAIKYQGLHPLASIMGQLLSERIANAGGIGMFDLIIPIPLHWTRQRQRGFNQSTKIAESLGERLNVPVRVDVLARKKRTADQTGLTSGERKKNMFDAFRVRKSNDISNVNVLLVDDVTTTGATLMEAGRQLSKAGCKEIHAGVISVAQ